MTFRTLLMLIFAPVLGLFVRVRAFAVVAALVCAVGLPVGGSALAQSEEETTPELWETFGCKLDEMDDSKFCTVTSPWAKSSRKFKSFAKYQCGEETDGKKWEIATLEFNYLNLDDEIRRSGKYEYHNVALRWDEEVASENVLWRQIGDKTLFWKHDSDQQEAIRQFQEKSQLRVRLNYFSDGGVVFTYPLAGAKATISEARRECGFEPESPESTEE